MSHDHCPRHPEQSVILGEIGTGRIKIAGFYCPQLREHSTCGLVHPLKACHYIVAGKDQREPADPTEFNQD